MEKPPEIDKSLVLVDVGGEAAPLDQAGNIATDALARAQAAIQASLERQAGLDYERISDARLRLIDVGELAERPYDVEWREYRAAHPRTYSF